MKQETPETLHENEKFISNSPFTNIQNNRNNPCISVIIPTHKTSPERAVDSIAVDKVVKQVRDNMVLKYGKESAELTGKLEAMVKDIDFVHTQSGLGLFVSPEVSEIVYFPFPVSEKVMVGDKFHTRDVFYMAQYMEDYFLLSLNKDVIRLFKGNGSRLREIINDDFPRKFEDDYEYGKSSYAHKHNSALKTPEKDKSVVIEERFRSFVKEADKALKSYLHENNIPLVITGVKQELGYFHKASEFNKRVAGAIEGNYNYNNLSELGEMAFERIKKIKDERVQQRKAELVEAIGKEMAVTGLHSVWRAAQEGKGLLLMVEKDFVKPGFLKENGEQNLYLTPPADKHVIISDAVEAIMDTVLEKKGEIMVVENGELTEQDQIALLLRYT